ncbi:hypothetical protein BCR34DRAFT_568898 [Clohesyomyces aquaticus]|uniref:FAD-binding domain-containing protein n=1 Tax=Clohesyomyces aquaticus TaxID=1231657 RepID=A0A1Y1ZFY7_9PLEO|nr:hypothetical protein BCR34DRAFT_568898 [Clohesyomyces aquaticus]
MPGERVLICGAGIAGSITAYWLSEYGFRVVVIERSKREQKAGQGLEIEEPALSVVRAMGVLATLQERKTGEMGFTLVNEKGHSWGTLGAGGISLTGALEIMRGDLTEVLCNRADESPNVGFRFETTIRGVRQSNDKCMVDTQKRGDADITTEEFDLVIGADGVNSLTRQMVLGRDEELGIRKPIGAFVAYFSITSEEQDWPYSQLCHYPGRKILWIRPVGKDSKTSSVYLIHLNDDVPALHQANVTGDRQKQKEAFAELYKGLGWQTERVIDQMMNSENFYSDQLAQIKLPNWSKNRVGFVGDSAWAPTPFTGEGNQLAIIGAWVLAQELSRNRNQMGFEMYEKRFRGYVENAQAIPGWGYAPYILCPETAWGILSLQTVFWLIAGLTRFFLWTGMTKMMPERGGSLEKHPLFDLQMDVANDKKGI